MITNEMLEAMKKALARYSPIMPIDAALSDALTAALNVAATTELLGYANVYRDHDRVLELGSADIDELADVVLLAADYMEHCGIAEIRLIPNSAGKSGEQLAALAKTKEAESAPHPLQEQNANSGKEGK